MGNSETRIGLLAGASGLVGGYALQALLDSSYFARIYAVTRRPLGREHPRLANRIVRFDTLESQLQGITCHTAFCTLGTTMRAAGSSQAFRKVDVDYVLAFARAARAAQAQRLVVVSSVGAAAGSKNFYLRSKGEMEEALGALGFAALDILQPSVLLGWRREMRPLELAAALVMPLVNPFLTGRREAYRGIAAQSVAAAMLGAALSGRRGTYRYTYPAIRALALVKRSESLPAGAAKSPGNSK